jgi:hypothetical protein
MAYAFYALEIVQTEIDPPEAAHIHHHTAKHTLELFGKALVKGEVGSQPFTVAEI